jgi:hypothetical protein
MSRPKVLRQTPAPVTVKSLFGRWMMALRNTIQRSLRGVRARLASRPSSARDLPPLPFPPPATPEEPRHVSGVLKVSVFSDRPVAADLHAEPAPVQWHVSTWRNGPLYQGHSNNDLRGFVDGRFRRVWNQTDQIHVRTGRGHGRPVLGERELFRNLHRWEQLSLPQGSRILQAAFELVVEQGPDRPLDVFLYRVNMDWNPGHGGVNRDNRSEPAPGEVWWNERMHGSASWGLPGAGFASDTHPDADTPVTALAWATYRPGEPLVSFRSRTLTNYVQERVDQRQPLLLLIKLSDHLEDLDRTSLVLFSSTYGDSCNVSGRPRLELEWTSPAEIESAEYPIVLEHGRSTVLPRMATPEMRGFAVSFVAEERSAHPTVQARGAHGELIDEWQDATLPAPTDWDWLELRLDTLHNPIPFGQCFESHFRVTLIRTGPPETQQVAWMFRSPSDRIHFVRGRYVGNYTWEARFVPDEVGRWSYYWTHTFRNRRFFSPPGLFDVFISDFYTADAALKSFHDMVVSCDLPPGNPRIRAFGDAFKRLERAVLRIETPASFDLTGQHPNPLGEQLDTLREELSGTPPSRWRVPPVAGSADGVPG